MTWAWGFATGPSWRGAPLDGGPHVGHMFPFVADHRTLGDAQWFARCGERVIAIYWKLEIRSALLCHECFRREQLGMGWPSAWSLLLDPTWLE